MFENKMVAIVNKQIKTGTLMNALAHMCVGFGAHMGAERLHLMNYRNSHGEIYPNISKMPFIILQEKNSNKLTALLDKARETGIHYSAFTDTMTVGTWEEQKAKTLATAPGEIVIYGLVLFGPKDVVSAMTQKLSLYRGANEE